MTEHILTNEFTFDVQLDGGHPDDWTITDGPVSDTWECTCGETFVDNEGAAKHYRETR